MQRAMRILVGCVYRKLKHGRSGDEVLCLSQIKSEYIGDAAHPGLEGEEHALPFEPCAIGAHPCPTIGACASHYSSSCKTAARDEDAACRIQQHGQGIPAGSNRSAVQHIRFAMASAATSVDHECPWIELSNKDFAIGPVPVADQIARGLLPAACLRDLICDPFCGRMRGNAKP